MFCTFLRATNRLEITRCDASTKSVYSIPYRLMYRIWLSMYSKFLRHLKYEVKVIICCQCVNERGIIPENYSGVRVPSFSLNKKKHSLNDLEWSALYSTFWARTNHVLKVLTCMFVWVPVSYTHLFWSICQHWPGKCFENFAFRASWDEARWQVLFNP